MATPDAQTELGAAAADERLQTDEQTSLLSVEVRPRWNKDLNHFHCLSKSLSLSATRCAGGSLVRGLCYLP